VSHEYWTRTGPAGITRAPDANSSVSTINRPVYENCVQTRSGAYVGFAAFAHILEIIVWWFVSNPIERAIQLWHGTCLPTCSNGFQNHCKKKSSWHTAKQSSEANQPSLQKFHGSHQEDI
jgi:hypothetical protein